MYIPPAANVLEEEGDERTVELVGGAVTTQYYVGEEGDGEWMQMYDDTGDPILLNSECPPEDEDW